MHAMQAGHWPLPFLMLLNRFFFFFFLPGICMQLAPADHVILKALARPGQTSGRPASTTGRPHGAGTTCPMITGMHCGSPPRKLCVKLPENGVYFTFPSVPVLDGREGAIEKRLACWQCQFRPDDAASAHWEVTKRLDFHSLPSVQQQ